MIFLTLTISFPLATLAFIFDWPLLPKSTFHGIVIAGLVLELIGLYIFKTYSVVEKDARRFTVSPDSTLHVPFFGTEDPGEGEEEYGNLLDSTDSPSSRTLLRFSDDVTLQ